MPGTDFLMPFGKYKGIPVSDCPPAYLRWVYENVAVYGKLKAEIERTLEVEPVSDDAFLSEIGKIGTNERIDRIVKNFKPSSESC